MNDLFSSKFQQFVISLGAMGGSDWCWLGMIKAIQIQSNYIFAEQVHLVLCCVQLRRFKAFPELFDPQEFFLSPIS
jgi:hypothetical protein